MKEKAALTELPVGNDYERSYYCINCLTPTGSLYRIYNSPTSVKLIQCTKCHDDVDDYIERDWLLVVIDLILLREEAYRHVLCNRLQDVKAHWYLGVLGSCIVLQILHLLSAYFDDPTIEITANFN